MCEQAHRLLLSIASKYISLPRPASPKKLLLPQSPAAYFVLRSMLGDRYLQLPKSYGRPVACAVSMLVIDTTRYEEN